MRSQLLLTSFFCIIVPSAFPQSSRLPEHPGAWQPIDDYRYFQEIGRKIDAQTPINDRAQLATITGRPIPPRQTDSAEYAETTYTIRDNRLALLDGDQLDAINVADWGKLPSGELRDILALGNALYIATSNGLAVLRGMTLATLTGKDGLPWEDLTCLAVGFNDDLWIGSTRGAIRYIGGQFQYFAGKRWLPNDHVNVIDVDSANKSVYIGTKSGVGVIEYHPYTFQKKAEYYERHLEAWGQKRLGFVHKLEWDSALNEWVREVSDNDAGWSTHYLTAMCFKYAATGDRDARREAVNFFNSLKWMEEISGIPGYPARSVWAPGEIGHKADHGSGGLPAEWHPTPDGNFEWKGDTSSDEIDAHVYAVSIFHDLVANDEEKARAREHISRVVSHIIDNGWVLRDVDGKPTVWGRWDPEYFASKTGHYARGLNGLEILSFVKTAHALTGDPKFDEAYKQLLAMGYHEEVLRQKLVFPPDDIFHSDDRLAFYVYYPLLKYETDPHLRSIYRRSLERSWDIERIEHNPWFNFIYGALTGNDCDAEQSAAHLREWSLDLVHYSFENSHRADLGGRTSSSAYSDHANVVRALSPRERGPLRWSDSPDFNGGAGAQAVVDPSGWLDAYWMARYYGMIKAPEAKSPHATLHRSNYPVGPGAKPYAGPPRP